MQTENCIPGKASVKIESFPDQDCVIRVGVVALNLYNLDYDHKHPILLPKLSKIVTHYVDFVHQEVGHLGRENVISYIKRYVQCSLKSLLWEFYYILSIGICVYDTLSFMYDPLEDSIVE